MRAFTSAFVLGGLLLTGCGSFLNEGSVRLGAAAGVNNTPGDNVVTDVIYRPSSDEAGALKPGQDVYVTLLSGYICDFREFGGVLNLASSSNLESERCNNDAGPLNLQGQGTRGEIVVLAGFQFRDGSANQPDTPEERVIYYNDDVRETGQLLNFANLPVYGPAPVKDASARLRVSILELDKAESEQQAALLNTLAQVGSTFASPMYGAVIGVLGKIGEGLIRSNDDDREMAFDAGFDPTNAESKVHRHLLREGYLVLMRRERRSDTDHFEKIRVCPDRGVIIHTDSLADCDAAKQTGGYYAESTWLLLRVSQERPEVADAELTRTLQQLTEASKRPQLDATPVLDAAKALKQQLDKQAEKRKGKGEAKPE